MAAIKIVDDIWWVGAQDPDLRVFDIIMQTEFGTSYNAYLIKGADKIALVETVKDEFFDEYINNIQEVVKLEDIDYLIMNHSEPDHAGSVERLLDLIPDLTIVGHPNVLEFLSEICNRDFNLKRVGDKRELELGGKTLHFISALLLHWPDTIYSYVKEDKLLFTCDSFGCHYSDPRLFNDLIGGDFTSAYKYYFDKIMRPFRPHVLKALNKLENYEVDIICPGHGPVLRTNIPYYLDLYREWSQPDIDPDPRPKIVMPYLSAHGYTAQLADAIESGILRAGDFNFKRFDLSAASMDEVVTEIDSSCGLIIGSPTICKDTLPPVWELLARLSPIIHKGMIATAFGAYGWSGEAVPFIEKRLVMLRMHVLPGLRVRFKASGEQLKEAELFGERFARVVLSHKTASLEDEFLHITPDTMREGVGEYSHEYRSDDLVVHWNPQRCMHDTHCFIGLPEVFDPEVRPWVKMEGASAAAIIQAIDRCPSGALKYSIPEGSSIDPKQLKGPGLMR